MFDVVLMAGDAEDMPKTLVRHVAVSCGFCVPT